MESNSLDTPRHQNVFMCALNNKVMWRPIQPMLNNYMWTSGPEPRGCQKQIFLLYLTIFNSVVPVILMLLGVKTITVSLNTCISYGKCIYMNVHAVGVKIITAYLKYIFYGKYIHEPCCEKTNILDSDLVRHKPGCTATEDG